MPTDPAALSRLARRAARDPFFLAHGLARWAAAKGLPDDAAVCAALGCDAGTLARLRLCRRPATPAEAGRVAAKFGVAAEVVGEIAAGWKD